MEMDKRTILAVILIVLVMLATPYYMEMMGLNKPPVTTIDSTTVSDTLTNMSEVTEEQKAEIKNTEKSEPAVTEKEEEIKTEINKDKLFVNFADTVTYLISTPLVNVKITNLHGGNIAGWELKNYKSFHGGGVELIDDNYFNFGYFGENGKYVETENVVAIPLNENMEATCELDEKAEPIEIKFQIKINEQQSIIRKFIINPYDYHIEVVQEFYNMGPLFHGDYYDYQWKNGIPLTEENVKDDYMYNSATIFMGDELEHVDADKEYKKHSYNGVVDWTAVRNKYFAVYLKAKDPQNTEGVVVEAVGTGNNSKGVKKIFNNSLIYKKGMKNSYIDSLVLYLGPLDYAVLKKYDSGFEKLVLNRNWYERFTRPIALLMLPIFKFLYKLIGNYGFVIIVFSMLLKLLLSPLTKKSYQSMKEMHILQPQIAELKEKYKDNPQKLNKATMELYKKHGVNPLGGCLPTLLQMPVLFALFSLFRSTIQLRGQEFIFWIKDLSAPDVIHLGVNLPLIGSTLHVLPILSSATMIFQSQQTSGSQQNKAMMYMMPIMMLFFLYNFPSGLHLYYFVFNIFSFIQQKMISEPKPVPVTAGKKKKK